MPVVAIPATQKPIVESVSLIGTITANEEVEITSGLQPGDLVVVEGHQKIGPGMPVQVAGPEKTAPYQQ